MTKNEKISKTLKERYANRRHHAKGASFRPRTEEEKEHLRLKSIEAANRRGRVTDKHKRARNKANVYAYRARLRNAIPEDADLKLIRTIYENCPDGYHVDHIVALASNGLHHQDNLQYLKISENCRKGKSDKYDKSLAISWKEYIPS